MRVHSHRSGCSQVAVRGVQGCGAEQGPCCAPGAVGSALSLPEELPRVLQGEAEGGRSPSPLEGQSRVLLLLPRGCCLG